MAQSAATAPPQEFDSAPPPSIRWTVLFFISLAMFGNYYIYDSIAPVADILKTQLSFSDLHIGWLNSIYSIPNLIMVLIGGIIIDRIGTRKSTMIFSALCVVGAAVTAASSDFHVMASGRLIFGLGAESMIVAVTTALAKWFKGRQLSFAFGLNLVLARAGSFAADNSPSWARVFYDDWQKPLLLAVVVGMTCVIGALVYWILESNAERRYRLGQAGETDKLQFSDLFSFGKSYWLIVGLCATFYSAIFPFRTFAIKFFIEFHGATREEGGFYNSMLVLFAMICSPLFGLAADYVGRRSKFMIAGSVLLMPVYLMLVYLPISVFVPMTMMGVAFALIPAIMWPAVAYVVEERRLGTAYGLMTLVQQLGVAAFNSLLGYANDAAGASAANPSGHAPGMWLLTTLGFLGLFFALRLSRVEAGPGGHGLDSIRAGDR